MECRYYIEANVKKMIKICQDDEHVQQVAFSTYHNCLTQICFTCNQVRTSIEEKEVQE